MKKYIVSLICLISMTAYSQSYIDNYIKEAQGYLAEKNYKQAQLSLQDAMNEINNLIARQIAEALPAEINGLKASGETDNSGAMGLMGGGLHISKNYQHPAKTENQADVVIMANSPLMSMMGMYLNNPAMMGQGAKSCRVGSTRAVIKTEMTDHYDDNGGKKEIRSSEIQIPLTQTLITLNLRGFASEAEELAFASKLDVEKLRVALGE